MPLIRTGSISESISTSSASGTLGTSSLPTLDGGQAASAQEVRSEAFAAMGRGRSLGWCMYCAVAMEAAATAAVRNMEWRRMAVQWKNDGKQASKKRRPGRLLVFPGKSEEHDTRTYEFEHLPFAYKPKSSCLAAPSSTLFHASITNRNRVNGGHG